MALALPGARSLFSHMQHALKHRSGGHIALAKGVHDALDDFRWMHSDLSQHPTWLYELVPLEPALVGSHDAAASGAGGVWFPQATAIPRQQPLSTVHQGQLQCHVPTTPVLIVWRMPFPPDVQIKLASWNNPHGPISNSDLELAGGLCHNEVATQCNDV